MPKTQRTTLVILIALSLVAAGVNLARRMQAEAANQSVAIVVDYDRCQQLAATAGQPTDAFLRRLKSAGATHVAVAEQTLGDLIQAGQVRVVPAGDSVALLPEAGVARRVLGQLDRRAPRGIRISGMSGVAVQGAPGQVGIRYRDPMLPVRLAGMGMGYDEATLADATAANLKVVARPIAEGVTNKMTIDAALGAAHKAGAQVVIFSGTQVMGLDKLIEYTADQLNQRGMLYGYVEMAKQVGEAGLSEALKCKLIRCHAMSVAEMAKVTPAKAVDRFRLAVRERNIRLCYLRPYALASDDPLSAGLDHVSQIVQAVQKAGLKTGTPAPYQPLTVPKPLLAACLIGAGAGLIWLIQILFGLSAGAFWTLVAADVVLSLGAAFAAGGLAADVGALGAGVVFPVLAFTGLRFREPGGKPCYLTGLKLFLGVSAVSLIGGLLIAGCLSDLPHMMQLETFRGVKLAQVLPLLAVLMVWVGRSTNAYQGIRTEAGEHAPEWPALWPGIVEATSAVVRYWHAVVILIGLAMLAMMVMRSGNTTPVPPSDMELKVRSILDQALVIRPRTKEIMLGHPVLLLALAFLAAGRRRGLWIALLVGAVGQVSLVNTFGHIHTPLWISLVRVANGIWLGAAVAGMAWLILRRRMT